MGFDGIDFKHSCSQCEGHRFENQTDAITRKEKEITVISPTGVTEKESVPSTLSDLNLFWKRKG